MQDYEVYEAFRKKKIRQYSITLLIIPLILLKIFDQEIMKIGWINEIMISAIAVLIVSILIIFSLINWRCPKCEKYLGKETSIKYCKKCGIQLVEE